MKTTIFVLVSLLLGSSYAYALQPSPESINVAYDVASDLLESHRFPDSFLYGDDAKLGQKQEFELVENLSARNAQIDELEFIRETIQFELSKRTNDKNGKMTQTENMGYRITVTLFEGKVSDIEIDCIKCN